MRRRFTSRARSRRSRSPAGSPTCSPGCPPRSPRATASTSAVVVPLYRGVAAQLAARRARRSTPARRSRSRSGRIASRRALRVARRRPRRATASSTARRSTIAPARCTGPAAPASSPTTTCGSRALGKAALEHGADRCSAARSTCCTSTTGRARPRRSTRGSRSAPCAIVATIHNLAYRGIFPKHAMAELGLPWSLFDARTTSSSTIRCACSRAGSPPPTP